MMGMTPQLMNAEFSGDYLACIRDFALSKGLDLADMVKDVDLPLALLLNPPENLQGQTLIRICANMLGQCRDFYEALLEFSLSFPLSVHGVLGIAVKSSQNLRVASDLIVSFSAIRADAFRLNALQEDGYFKLRFIPAIHQSDIILQMLEMLVLVNMNKLGKELIAQHGIAGQSILNFPQRQPKHFPFHLFDSTTQIQFDQPHMELGYPVDWVELPISCNNEPLRSVAVDQCQRHLDVVSSSTLEKQIRNLLREPGGYNLKLEDAARRLHMSTSTLKRRLIEQGTTFMAIKSKDRFELGADLLRSREQSIEQTAEYLGFTDLSNFSKFFKSWSGMTPNQFKNTVDQPRKIV